MPIDPHILNHLQNYNQAHLISYWDQLDYEQRAILLRDIANTDFEHVSQAFEGIQNQLVEQNYEQPIDQLMEPIPEHLTGSIETSTKEQLDAYRREGSSI